MIPVVEYILAGAAVLILVSIIANKVSGRLGLPALLIFIIVGMLAGSEGPGGIFFDNAQAAQSIGVVGLALILFSGGLDTRWTEVKPVFKKGLALSTAGVALTALIVSIAADLLLGFTPLEGFLLGAIVSSTDAAAVFSILRSRRASLKGRLRPLLEFESGSNDPMAIFLTIGAVSLIMVPGTSFFSLVPLFIQQMAVGGLFGYGMGRAAAWLINAVRLEYEGLYAVLTLACAIFIYSTTVIVGGNGFLAAYIAGLVIGNAAIVHRTSLIRFHEGIAWLMQIALFLTLGLFVFPSGLMPVILPGIILAFVLIFIARPVAVYLALMPWRMERNEKLMISWVGLRGAAPIVLATFPLLSGVPESQTIFNMVFFMVIASAILHGTSIPFVARVLGLSAPLPKKSRFGMEPDPDWNGNSELIELVIPPASPAAGKQVVHTGLPAGTLIILVARGDDQFSPRGSTVLVEGDSLLILTPPGNADQVRTIFLGPGGKSKEPALDIPEWWFTWGKR
ncbi:MULTISPECIES: potassium/proton antiporter [unclassified Methanoregula]|uniref:potassium/proton antiporter n=1 Tax=unclassified Methanoregula TaxID=2649730 RepID=UPI0009CF7AFC|nr:MULTISPECIES: potassium/proton antiporter [unclassified Methanoregula]OPX64884.1 MAG: Na(+)/H(+) antiporter 1 [Methanoregula sp. PtaB.Bin085]OPY32936.1 MAG: Na(+)/H(+) antiporter 1 [Methanoregula sp. PtaU1.Bin006]